MERTAGSAEGFWVVKTSFKIIERFGATSRFRSAHLRASLGVCTVSVRNHWLEPEHISLGGLVYIATFDKSIVDEAYCSRPSMLEKTSGIIPDVYAPPRLVDEEFEQKK